MAAIFNHRPQSAGSGKQNKLAVQRRWICAVRQLGGKNMDRKLTGIVAYLTFVGWILAYVAGDQQGAWFHLNQA